MSSTRKIPRKTITISTLVISTVTLLAGFLLGTYMAGNKTVNVSTRPGADLTSINQINNSQLLDTSAWETYSFQETVEGFGEGTYTTSFRYPRDWKVTKQQNKHGCEYYLVKKSSAGAANGLFISDLCTAGDSSVSYPIPNDSVIVHIRTNTGVSEGNSYTLRFPSGMNEYKYKYVSSYVTKKEFDFDDEAVNDFIMTSEGFGYSISFMLSPDMAEQSDLLVQTADTIVASLDSAKQ